MCGVLVFGVVEEYVVCSVWGGDVHMISTLTRFLLKKRVKKEFSPKVKEEFSPKNPVSHLPAYSCQYVVITSIPEHPTRTGQGCTNGHRCRTASRG